MLVFHGNKNNGTNEISNRHHVSGWDNKLPLDCMETTSMIVKSSPLIWDLEINVIVATHAIKIRMTNVQLYPYRVESWNNSTQDLKCKFFYGGVANPAHTLAYGQIFYDF